MCAQERRSRALAAKDILDKRFVTTMFLIAPPIFANNDIKYETDKLRAKHYAVNDGKPLKYACANNMPTPDALPERPDMPSQKLAWLQRHDRETGNLYGVILLIYGMRVALTEHIDRNSDKQLLRWKVGYVHSWGCISRRAVCSSEAYVCCSSFHASCSCST